MCSPRVRSRSRLNGRRLAVWAALAFGWLLPSAGCQTEYAGMTLPSGKYMHDDVQYHAPGPDFPWSNTQAATQRARMQAMGMEVPLPASNAPTVQQIPTGPADDPAGSQPGPGLPPVNQTPPPPPAGEPAPPPAN